MIIISLRCCYWFMFKYSISSAFNCIEENNYRFVDIESENEEIRISWRNRQNTHNKGTIAQTKARTERWSPRELMIIWNCVEFIVNIFFRESSPNWVAFLMPQHMTLQWKISLAEFKLLTYGPKSAKIGFLAAGLLGTVLAPFGWKKNFDLSCLQSTKITHTKDCYMHFAQIKRSSKSVDLITSTVINTLTIAQWSSTRAKCAMWLRTRAQG